MAAASVTMPRIPAQEMTRPLPKVGRSIGRFFADEVASPLDLELWIGLPEALEPRVSQLAYAADWGTRSWSAEELAGDELLDRAVNNPPLFPPEFIPWNQSRWHRAEVPGAGGIGSARAMARLYACLAGGGTLDGIRLLSPETLERGRQTLDRRWDPLARAHADGRLHHRHARPQRQAGLARGRHGVVLRALVGQGGRLRAHVG